MGKKEEKLATMALAVASTLRAARAAAAASAAPRRWLNLHEDQSKALLKKYGATVQPFVSADTAAAAENGARELMAAGAPEIVLKALVHAGGRGKGHFSSGLKGGVRLSKECVRGLEVFPSVCVVFFSLFFSFFLTPLSRTARRRWARWRSRCSATTSSRSRRRPRASR
jgi:hypothetical protein